MIEDTVSKLGIDPFAVVTAALDYLKTREEEQTKRLYIWSHRDVLVKALDNEKEMILAYFDKIFSERKRSLEELYQLLHIAAAQDDVDKLHGALTGILGIIQVSPLKDLSEFRNAWLDSDFTDEL